MNKRQAKKASYRFIETDWHLRLHRATLRSLREIFEHIERYHGRELDEARWEEVKAAFGHGDDI